MLPKTKKPKRQVPVIKWSKYAKRAYTGEIVDGWTRGEGYVDQSLMIARNPSDYHSRDLIKAVKVLWAMCNPNYTKLADSCVHVLEEREKRSLEDILKAGALR